MRRQGVRVYWGDPSNWFDWPNLIAFGFIGMCRVIAWSRIQPLVVMLGAGDVKLAEQPSFSLHAIASWYAARSRFSYDLGEFYLWRRALFG